MPPRLAHKNVGAQILQACLDGTDSIFYLSPVSEGTMARVPARGGVPVLFPQFADRGILPKHGFVRSANWVLEEELITTGAHSARYSLHIQPNDYPVWPHAARLSLFVDAKADALVFTLQIRNTGGNSFHWTGGLHPYFLIHDVLRSSLSGLEGLGVQDRYDPTALVQPRGDLTWTKQPFERLFDGCPPLVLHTRTHSLQLFASGFDQWMVWNPGEIDGNAMADLPNEHWRRFICVEPVCVTHPVFLEPGQLFEGNLCIELLNEVT